MAFTRIDYIISVIKSTRLRRLLDENYRRFRSQWREHWLDSKQLLATRPWFTGIAETRTSRVFSEKSKHVLRVLSSEFETRTYYMLDKSNSTYDVYNTMFVRKFFWNLDNFACKVSNSAFILCATHDTNLK